MQGHILEYGDDNIAWNIAEHYLHITAFPGGGSGLRWNAGGECQGHRASEAWHGAGANYTTFRPPSPP